ncbi:MAG: D-alanyl-D-alanine endopeptidase [Aquabacterium sp.]|nr:MAG: D-alanyl-D-alanine endopeptidase [Aquabacterium sp.]
MLSVSISTTAEAATKARQNNTHTAKASKAGKAKPGARKGKARSRVAQAAPRASVVRAVPDSAEPAKLTPVSINAAAPARPSANLAAASSASGTSFGQLYGLHHTQDPLDLKSSVALVMDQDTNEVVFAKNSEAVLPIASLTKLMTAMVMVEAKLPLEETISVTSDDVDTEKNSSSRLAVGATLTRGELLHLALMSSENRAAHALGRTYPGGLPAFVVAMNAKARSLGMADTRYVDPTGLNSGNQSSAKDLASLVKAAYQQPLIRELSTSHEYAVRVGRREVQFHNTNSLVRNPAWDIGLQKTGYIVEAGRCLVMQAKMAGRKFIMVFLDSTGKYSRQADAERVRRWIESATQKGALSSLPHNKIQS